MYGDPMLCHQIPLWEWKPDPTRCRKDCQLIGLSCPPCLRIILAEDYSLTQGHAPSEGRLYPMTDQCRRERSRTWDKGRATFIGRHRRPSSPSGHSSSLPLVWTPAAIPSKHPAHYPPSQNLPPRRPLQTQISDSSCWTGGFNQI